MRMVINAVANTINLPMRMVTNVVANTINLPITNGYKRCCRDAQKHYKQRCKYCQWFDMMITNVVVGTHLLACGKRQSRAGASGKNKGTLSPCKHNVFTRRTGADCTVNGILLQRINIQTDKNNIYNKTPPNNTQVSDI